MTRAMDILRNSSWQPIATAPKDGTRFLAYDEQELRHRTSIEAAVDLAEWNEELNRWENSDGEPWTPTHWSSDK